MTRVRTLSAPPDPAPGPSPGVLLLLARIILFIEDLMRMLEDVAGATACGYLRRATPIDQVLAELRAIASGLTRAPRPEDAEPESDPFPPPYPRADPACMPASASTRALIDIRARGSTPACEFSARSATRRIAPISLRYRNENVSEHRRSGNPRRMAAVAA